MFGRLGLRAGIRHRTGDEPAGDATGDGSGDAADDPAAGRHATPLDSAAVFLGHDDSQHAALQG